MTADVSILIVTYRCRDAVNDCLTSIPAGVGHLSHEVVVVDNASGDGTAEMIRTDHPDVTLVALDENTGFASGVNRAAEAACGAFLLLLNPDTVVHPGAIEELVTFARMNPQHGLYGGRTVNPDGTVHPGSCWGAPSLWSLSCFATMLSTAFRGSSLFDPESLGSWQRDSVREVDVVTGCLLLVPARVWRELGGLDTTFFMYGEDVDLALRAKKAGYRPVITPDAVVTHEIGVSSASRPEKFLLVLRAKVTVMKKHWSPVRAKIGCTLLLTGVGARALASSLQRGSARAGTGAGGGTWRVLWTDRSRWLHGFSSSPEDARS